MPTTTTTDVPTDPLSRGTSQKPQDVAGASSSAAAAAVVQQGGGGSDNIISGGGHHREKTLPRASESGQSKERGDVDVTAPQGLSLPTCSGDDGDNDQRGPPHGSREVVAMDNEPGKRDVVMGGSRGPRNASEGRGSGRVAKGRWVVTMMVPGRKLWGSSPAVLSQYKRFRRSSQQPKIARDQVKSNVASSFLKSCRRVKSVHWGYCTLFVSIHNNSSRTMWRGGRAGDAQRVRHTER